jgi:hypothetical protein
MGTFLGIGNIICSREKFRRFLLFSETAVTKIKLKWASFFFRRLGAPQKTSDKAGISIHSCEDVRRCTVHYINCTGIVHPLTTWQLNVILDVLIDYLRLV